ncbi:D-alanyl-lipoteichoic acid biosynthesis protein DltD [Arcobacter caeni]|uniref:DltD n=1 Tax=Arcobacter caeni TaxID=1912877 RepID=A0A363D279_9BACT|nr:D-alanyl-lipoteichoic acid biosynthesis protein DltD [Arcobacter caeni]PUE65458.1 DltD [Arcobacter caeni]
MNKFFVNIYAFLIALVVVISLLYISKNQILNYYAIPLQDSLQRTTSLQDDLSSGKIVVFGSSELVMYPDLKFLPQNYFNNELKLPIRVQGNEGQQDFVIMSQLAACDNEKVRENARVVVLLSPSWFSGSSDNGLTMPKFLEYMYPGMMNKLYFQSEADDKYKISVSDYIKNNITYIKNPNFLYEYSYAVVKKNYFNDAIRKIIIQSFDNKDPDPELINYKKPILNYDNLKVEAVNNTAPVTNNSYGINDEYFTKYIQPEIDKNNFPFGISIPELSENEEYHDLLVLLDFLKDYKIQPLFVMQDLHPYAFANNREEMNKLMLLIKSKVEEHGYKYFDKWTYKKEDYKIGTLTDIVHPGELGWVDINQKIIEQFMTKEEK